MQRTVEYRRFEIHIDLVSTSTDMSDVWFRIEGPINPPGVAALGECDRRPHASAAQSWLRMSFEE